MSVANATTPRAAASTRKVRLMNVDMSLTVENALVAGIGRKDE